MRRNLDRRVEVAVPVRDERIRRYLKDTVLDAYLRDNFNAWVLQVDGNYEKISVENTEPFDSQMFFVGQDPKI